VRGGPEEKVGRDMGRQGFLRRGDEIFERPRESGRGGGSGSLRKGGEFMYLAVSRRG